MITTTAAELVADAKSRIENLSPADVAAELAAKNVLLVDIREAEELQQNGTIPGAVHAPRGMIEFYADPTGAYHRPEFDPGRRTILCRASGGARRWRPMRCGRLATSGSPSSTAGSRRGGRPG